MIILFFLFLLFPGITLAGEPTIQRLQQEAIQYLGFDQREMEGWKKRARWAAALPRLQTGFERDLKDVVRLSTKDSVSVTGGDVFIGPDESNFDQNLDQGTRFEVKAIWYLDELLFHRDTLAVSSERRDWVRERGRVLQEVTEAYFTRRRLLQELHDRRTLKELKERKKLLLDQVAGILDAYTGGWFSTELEKP